MINALISDLTRTSRENIRRSGIRSMADVRSSRRPLVCFSDAMAAEQQELKQFLRRDLYQHYLVARMANKARRIVTDLFQAFQADPKMLPPQYREPTEGQPLERAIADYVAGMTDRYAIREHRRLFAVAEI